MAPQGLSDRLAARPEASDTSYVVGVAVFHGDKLLLVERAGAEVEAVLPCHWEIPGGHIENNETVGECIKRETFEETGLAVVDVLAEFEPMRWQLSGGRQSVQFNFLAAAAASHDQPPQITLNPGEHAAYRWISSDEAEGLLMTAEMATVVADAFSAHNALA